MPHYVDGYVIPIKRKKIKEYKKMAQWGKKVWMKHGALSYYECIIDDFTKHGLGFKKMCKLKPDETAVFAFIVYKSKSHRNSVNKKVLKEMAKAANLFPKMPFDMNRFSMAGCQAIVHSR
ncbi:MAG: DUF1428 domain-containing protein [Oligoflexia bacterium]|nr:DUF1428 domain-containing protein [Oligoflexia bacterium]